LLLLAIGRSYILAIAFFGKCLYLLNCFQFVIQLVIAIAFSDKQCFLSFVVLMDLILAVLDVVLI
jgi:hypothetical protein